METDIHAVYRRSLGSRLAELRGAPPSALEAELAWVRGQLRRDASEVRRRPKM